MQVNETKPVVDWQPMLTMAQAVEAFDALGLRPISEDLDLSSLLRMVVRCGIHAMQSDTAASIDEWLTSASMWASKARAAIAKAEGR